jgi:hypothetical protein
MLKREFINRYLGSFIGAVLLGDSAIRAVNQKNDPFEQLRSAIDETLLKSTKELGEKLSKFRGKPKIGYISLDYLPEGTHGGDWWVVREDGQETSDLKADGLVEGMFGVGPNAKITSKPAIKRANDLEGWYEAEIRVQEDVPQEVIDKFGGDKIWVYSHTLHFRAPIKVYYNGNNPEYAKFKKEG